MSWFDRYKPASNHPQVSEADLAAARQKKLQADRLLRQQRREELQNQFLASKKAQEEADLAYRELVHEFLQLDPNIFEEDKMVVDFYEENGEDGEKALESLGGIQCPFMKDDVVFWFGQFEAQLMVIKVKSQWVKRIALQRFLPADVKQEVKSLLVIPKAQAGDDIYKRIKAELMDLFGPKPEDAYIRAKNRVMTGKPSQLGKALINDICKCPTKLQSGCCAQIVWGMYREAIPVVIRNHIAELPFNKDTYKQIFAKSDQVYDSNKTSHPQPTRGAAVAAVSNQLPSQPVNTEVAAIKPPRKNKKPNNANQQQQQQQQQQPATSAKPTTTTGNKGPRHATAKGDNDKLCRIHYRWGENGSYCAAPWKCPMKNIFKAPQ